MSTTTVIHITEQHDKDGRVWVKDPEGGELSFLNIFPGYVGETLLVPILVEVYASEEAAKAHPGYAEKAARP
jgi:hypothetical protein